MQAAVCQHLGLSVVPEPHDVADALAVALCHLFAQSNPLLRLESKKNL
jgi:Holliday junction resolvasome RuvABC endonuclease subunit